jgi:hypothetical protein
MSISKRASQVVIQPWDSAVNAAKQTIDQLDPMLLQNVSKIIVHPGGGGGQLGHVEMGPGKDPQEVHVFKDRVKEHVMRNANAVPGAKQTLSTNELERAIVDGITEVIAHEAGHIGKSRTPEQIGQGPFFGESDAEREARELMRKRYMMNAEDALLEASLAINNIRDKYAPGCSMVEPNLEFTVCASRDDQGAIIRKGLEIIKSGTTEPVMVEVCAAEKFNQKAAHGMKVAKYLGIITHFVPQLDAISLANWQYDNRLKVTGRLDNDTIKKFADLAPSTKMLPKNFATVAPGLVYRGGLIFNESQMQALKDLGIQRIVSLHPSPEIARLCNAFDIEHVPAFMESGAPEELGRQLLGASVSKFLNEKPTYVHCYYGQDRTGGVIARYRTESGWPCQQAYKEAKAYGFKDMFVDLIDWFSEPCEEKPIDTVLGGGARQHEKLDSFFSKFNRRISTVWVFKSRIKN